MNAYERALSINPQSIPAMNAMSLILRTKEEFSKACEFLNAILKLDPQNGEAWGSLGMTLHSSDPGAHLASTTTV